MTENSNPFGVTGAAQRVAECPLKISERECVDGIFIDQSTMPDACEI